MSFEAALQFVPAYVLVVFRLAGMMLAAPFFGSARVPQRVKLMFALVLALGLVPGVALPRLPATTWELAAGIAGEMLFGLAIGTALSFVFVAVHWAGEIIGQQMGLGLGEVFDPQFGQGGSVVGDLYFMLALVVFLGLQGHHAMLRGVRATFDSLPLLAVGMSEGLLDLVVGLLQAATNLALQLSTPMLVTMLVVDAVLGFLARTVPQINVLSAGLSLRAVAGMVVLALGTSLAASLIGESLVNSVSEVARAWMPAALK